MTDEEISAINRKLAEWVGICPHEDFNHLTESDFFEGMPVCSACGVRFDEKVAPPDYFHTNAAMDLLGVLTKEHGYWYEMTSHADGTHTVIIGKWVDDAWEDGTSAWIRKYICESERQSTIPAAICHAIIELIEREGGL